MRGIIDIWGYAAALEGFIFGGWIDLAWDAAEPMPQAQVVMQRGTVTGPCLMGLYPRADVEGRGLGCLMLVEAGSLPDDALKTLVLLADPPLELMPSATIEHYDETKLFLYAKHFLGSVAPGAARTRFLKLLDRPHYTGVDTTSALPWPVHLDIDKTYLCPPHGLLVRGWFVDPLNSVARLRLCCGARAERLDPRAWVAVKRRDVVASLADRYGSLEDMCGFLAYVPDLYRPGQALHLEVELTDGSLAHRPVALSFQTGLAAIKEILGGFTLHGDALARGYEGVVGPAIASINDFRLKRPPQVDCLHFGAPVAAPRCTIIVPLYGRIDFLEYQLAFFFETLAADHEIIYVLDDPAQQAATQALAMSCHARFERPFTLMILSRNVGYAPANNLALAQARGEHVCFLNSDVFPHEPHWLEYMIESLAVTAGAGIAGAVLIYEDGTLQHDGCTFERLAVWANWPFPQLPRKGRRFARSEECRPAEAVTGACMVLRRELAVALGGFDEGYVVGDFEDVDLCFKMQQCGLHCVVDHRALLFHLERQSQAIEAGSWRMNLTLYNAWRFQARWRHRDI